MAVPVRPGGPSFKRSSRRDGSYLRVCGMPAGDGDASADHRRLRRVANRCVAPICVSVGSPCAANRSGDGPGAGGAIARTMGGTGMGRSSARYLLQTARDGHGERPRQHAGSARAGSRLSGSPPCRSRGVASASRRADGRRQETLSRGLHSGGGGQRRFSCLERDRLYVRSPHLHQRRHSLISWLELGDEPAWRPLRIRRWLRGAR